MIKRTFLGAIQLLGGLGAGFAILMLVVAWQLSSGPISLSYITPYIENALNAVHPSFRFRLENTILTWAGWDRTFDIRVLNVHVIAPDDTTVASVPELSLSLSARALVRGRIAPRSLEMFGPRLVLERQRDGTLMVGIGEGTPASDRIAKRLVQQLLSRPDPKHAMSYLSRVEIIGADLTLSDQFSNRAWRAPMATVLLHRDVAGVRGEASFDIRADGRDTHIEVSGIYRNESRRTDLNVKFGEITPAAFEGLHAQLALLKGFNLPIAGTVTLGIDGAGTIATVGFDITGGKGTVTLPEPVKQTLAVQSVALKGRYGERDERLEVEHFSANLGLDGAVLMPGSPAHAIPLKNVALKGRYDDKDRRFEVNEALLDLRGPRLRVTGMAEDIGGAMTVTAEGTLSDLRTDEIRTYWPSAWGHDAWRWSVTHLSDGVAPQIRARVVLKSNPDGRFSVATLDGEMDIVNATVDYLPPMPKVRKATVGARFDKTRFDIVVRHGEVEGLTVKQGRINLTGLDQEDQYADVELLIDGPFRRAMTLIEHEPLVFASTLGIDPATTDGHSVTTFKLNFPLAKNLTLDQVRASANAKLSDVSIRGIFLGQDLRNGQLALKVDKTGVDVTGAVRFVTTPASLTWRQNFGPKAPFRNRYVLTGRLEDVRKLADVGIDLKPFSDDVIEGAVGVEVRFTDFGNANRALEVKADLTDAALRVDTLGWTKPTGTTGTAQASMTFKGSLITDIPLIALTAGDMTLHGRARYAADGTGLDAIEFDRIAFGKTDIVLTIRQRADGGWHADAKGKSFNLEPLWRDFVTSARDAVDKETLHRLKPSLAIALDQVWFGPERTLRNVRGTFAHDGTRWANIRANGEVATGKTFEWSMRPVDGGKRSVLIRAADAGAMLRVTDFYDNMTGGALEITGTYEDTEPGQPLVGTLTAKDYRVVKAPILTRLLNVLALTGILDELQGGGLGFTNLEIPFTLREGLVNVNDAKAFGPSLGFTASGRVYTHADIVDIDGTVVPAYVINSALGYVPVLGDIFTGGAKGGGVFAATFKISGAREDPQVTVNPLTALAPGFLRNLFGIFSQVRPAGAGKGDSGPVQR